MNFIAPKPEDSEALNALSPEISCKPRLYVKPYEPEEASLNFGPKP